MRLTPDQIGRMTETETIASTADLIMALTDEGLIAALDDSDPNDSRLDLILSWSEQAIEDNMAKESSEATQ